MPWFGIKGQCYRNDGVYYDVPCSQVNTGNSNKKESYTYEDIPAFPMI
jgi:hypothetical protein